MGPGGNPAGVTTAPASNNAVETMGRSLDALSLKSAPPAVNSSSNPNIDPSFPHLRDKAWFYGAITRAECDNLLNQYGQDGDFLVRSSETNVYDWHKIIYPFTMNFNLIFLVNKDWRLFRLTQGTRSQQAFPRSRGRSSLCHRSTEVRIDAIYLFFRAATDCNSSWMSIGFIRLTSW